jgi:tRNA threonylcarbamoyladenosine biosynthesis protein TsaB
MLVLAIDSATSACSAALWQDGTILARRYAEMVRGQSEALVPMIAETLSEAGRTLSEIDLLAVTVGPGAFTGIRIGLATARALALAAGKPLAGIATPDAVAAAVPPPQRQGRTILAILDSRREEVWVQAFAADLSPLSEVEPLTPAAIADRYGHLALVLTGDGAALALPLLPDAVMAECGHAPDAACVATLAAIRWAAGTALPPEPLYLRAADVTLPACPSS